MNLRASALIALGVPFLLGSCALDFPASAAADVRRVEVAQKRAAAPPAVPTMPVILFGDELHTGLILRLDWLQEHGYVRPRETRDQEWAAFSWGDETAYVQEEWLGLDQVFHALFQPSSSVMEIITFDYNVPSVCHHQRLYLAHVHEEDGAPLAAFLNACAVRDAEGVPETIGPASWGEGRLIRSPYKYYFPRICNIWTVEALKAAGFRMWTPFSLSADAVIRQATAPGNGFQQIWDPEWQMSGAPDEG